jgi:acetyl esterase/lipase
MAQTAAPDARFKQYDKNSDGKISRDEAKGTAAERSFDRRDQNKDGFLTPDESPRGRTRAPLPGATAASTAPVTHSDIRYRQLPGVEPNLNSLDVYAPKDAKNLPVMIYTHGGGWQGGDKANCAAKAALFTQAGFVFVSINYRLSPAVSHPAHIEDVVAALAWVKQNAARFGGDGSRMLLMGHSAGAHLTALAAVDAAKLKAAGLSPADFKAAIVLDNPAFDVLRLVRGGVAGNPATQPFGKDEASWRDASPQHHIAKNKSIAPMLLAVAGSPAGESMSKEKTGFNEGFAKALRDVGVRCEVVDATAFASHSSLNQNIGTPRDSVTAEIMRFVDSVLKSTPIEPALGATKKLQAQQAQTRPPTAPAQVKPTQADGAGLADRRARVARLRSDTPPPPKPERDHAPRSVKGTEWEFQFSRDFVAGTRDRHGKVMNATECNAIAAHNGMLFAGMTYVSEDKRDANARILVKRSARGPWEEDFSLGRDYARVSILESVSFTTDYSGKALKVPVPILLGSDRIRAVSGRQSVGVWARDDDTGSWHRALITKDVKVERTVASTGVEVERTVGNNNPEIRAFIGHLDRVTHIHLVFAFASNGAIYRGAYDPAVPGKVRWETQPELSGMVERPVCAAEANGVVYTQFAVPPDVQLAEAGGLYRRVDGTEPRWERVEVPAWRDPRNPAHTTRTGAMRGLTSIPGPEGDSLVFSWKEPNYTIERLTPSRTSPMPAVEINVFDYLRALWGSEPVDHLITGYNEFTPARQPDTGEQAHLIGLLAVPRDRNVRDGSSWLLVRRADGSYLHTSIPRGETDELGLGGMRSICASPFAEDKGRVFYFGGFDMINIRNPGNHAWIFKGTLKTK